jgi:hypothetical protein
MLDLDVRGRVQLPRAKDLATTPVIVADRAARPARSGAVDLGARAREHRAAVDAVEIGVDPQGAPREDGDTAAAAGAADLADRAFIVPEIADARAKTVPLQRPDQTKLGTPRLLRELRRIASGPPSPPKLEETTKGRERGRTKRENPPSAANISLLEPAPIRIVSFNTLWTRR